MKNIMIGLGLGMASGIGVTAYALTNPKTKRNADKVLNKAMDNATTAMNDLKKNMRQN